MIAIAADPLDTWNWRVPTPTGNHLYSVAANGTRYVAVGLLGAIAFSDDGENWVNADSGTVNTLRAVAWGNGQWVAVGDFGEILTSPDGIKWTRRFNGFFFDLNAVTWGGGLFIAVGENSSIITSPNAINWTLRTTGSNPLRAVVWGNGIFVAVGGEPPTGPTYNKTPGQPLILVSSNGVNWTQKNSPVNGQVACVTYAIGKFVAATTSLRTMVSVDGSQWSAGFEPQPSYGFEFSAVAYFGNRFIASYGSEQSLPAGYYKSTDGISWSYEFWNFTDGPFYGFVNSFATGPHGTVAVTGKFPYWASDSLVSSRDGHQWRHLTRKLPDFEYTATFAGGLFLLRERFGNFNPYLEGPETIYLMSSDGQKWDSVVVSESERFELPAYGKGIWVAGGDNGHVAVSTNSIHWRTIETSATTNLIKALFADGRFLMTGVNGVLLTSTNGTNWINQDLGTTSTPGDLAWHNGIYMIADGGGPAVFTSTDTAVWTRHSLPTNTTSIRQLLAWNEGFVALAFTDFYGSNSLLRSSNGNLWLPDTQPADEIQSIVANDNRLVGFRGDGSRTFQARKAGETKWSFHTLPWEVSSGTSVYSAPEASTAGQNTFLLTHSLGYILQSDPLTNSPPRFTQPLSAILVDSNSPVTLRSYVTGSAPLHFQWRRNGTNLPSSNLPFLTLPAREMIRGPISLSVTNGFGAALSGPASFSTGAPAILEISSDISSLRVRGTPNARYQIESSFDLGPATTWDFFADIEMPSFGGAVRIKNLSSYYGGPAPQRFFRGVLRP